MKRFSKIILSSLVALLIFTGATSGQVFASDYENHWAKEVIEKWSDGGVLLGYKDGSFRPSEKNNQGGILCFIS